MVTTCLWRIGWRHLVRHRWQSALSILGIALGVAVVMAVDLASGTAARSFELSMQRLSGQTTHQILAGPNGMPEHHYTELRIHRGLRRSAPVVEGAVRLRGESFTLLGLDPLAERPFRNLVPGTDGTEIRALLTHGNTLFMPAVSAHRLGFSVGDRIRLEAAGEETALDVLGLLGDQHNAALDGLLVTDIATAQELLGRIGRLDRIDLILDETEVEAVSEWLPDGTRLVTPGNRTAARARMSAAFITNLQAMSLLALLVGGYLIYNAMAFSVLQRRSLLGMLRILGVTRLELFRLLVLEVLLIGVVGTLSGMLLGVLLGQGLIQLVTQTINDLYFPLKVSRLLILPAAAVKALVLGIATALVAALIPALEAARSTPVTSIRRSSIEIRTHRALPWLVAAGLCSMASGLVLIWASGQSLEQGFVALFLIVLGYTLLLPAAVLKLSGMLLPLLKRSFGTVGLLAARGISAALSRTGMAVAALSLAVAATVGMGIMIASFRATVADWLEQTLQGDLYISIPSRDSERAATSLPPETAARLRTISGIRELSLGRRVQVEAVTGPVNLLAIDTASVSYRGFRFKGATVKGLWRRFNDGEVILVSEPYAYHHRLEIGDELKLLTAAGMRGFSVGGVFFDYGSDRGMLVLDKSIYSNLWQDPSVAAIGVYLESDAAADRVSTEIRQLLGGLDSRIKVRANREILEQSLQIFDRTFTITRVLRLLVVLVAFVGILSAFMALQLERRREYAILRAAGLTPGQQLQLVGLQTGMLGAMAGLLSLPLGWLMAEVLIGVINMRAFGWSLQRLVPFEVLFEALLLALTAALLAGVYPAVKMMKATPAAALRDE